MTEQAIFRLLDASANRVSEGLRTIEDFTRFVLNDASLTERTKRLRHRFASALAAIPRSSLIGARDVQQDVGTTIGTTSEMERIDAASVAIAAISRIQQSLRSLEEYGKIVSVEMAQRLEQLRYETYTLGQELECASQHQIRLHDARLYVLVDLTDKAVSVSGTSQMLDTPQRGNATQRWLNRLQALIDNGVNLIQIRDKDASDRLLWERCQLAAELIRANRGPGNCQLIINDRADIAAAVDADGVHVGQDELPTPVVRKILGPHKLIGLSTHSIEQAREAARLGANYIGCGPTFPSRTKQFSQFAGLEFLQTVAKEISLPAYAIGGISATNVTQVLETGITRVAVSSDVWQAVDCGLACQTLHELLRAA